MRSRCRSTSSTSTSTSSPTLTTSEGWLTWFHDSSEMCTRPSMPPRSTNAPKSTIEETVPLRRMPFDSFARISARSFLRPSSSSTRRDSTTLLRLRSISMTRASISVLRYMSRSLTRRRSTNDAGRKPRRPISRMRPPLTTSMTSPVTTSPALNFSSTRIHARSYSARFLDRIRRPSLSSFWSTRASIFSPSSTMSDGSASLRMDSSREGMTPSLLNPMSTSTSSCSILTTVPSTRSPSSNSVSVPSIIAFMSASEISSKSMTDVFLISVKTDPFQFLLVGDPSS